MMSEDTGIKRTISPSSSFTFAHNVESETKVDEVFELGIKAGAKSIKTPQKAAWDGYSGYFSDPFPAREAVCVKELPLGAKIEISMVAVKLPL
jgi:uncharacterized glyoxalase superfamily protein PhnB